MLAAALPVSAATPSAAELAEAHRWVESHLGASGTLAPSTLPPCFSFDYDGRPSASFLTNASPQRTARALDGQRTETTLVWNVAKGSLEVRCVAVEYRDFPTVEWTVFLRNTGAQATPMVSNLLALDAQFARPSSGQLTLHHHRGDDCTPDSYQPLETILGAQSDLRFAPRGGRPTSEAFPYFNAAGPGGGVMVAVGWPGQWQARFTGEGERGWRARAGQEVTHFRLLPGEEVRTPLIVLQFWQGERVRAQNLWRRWMLAHNLPRTGDGRPPAPMFTSCSGGFFPGLQCSEASERQFIDAFVAAGLKLDYWWLDAGWYPCRDNWPMVGTWAPDTARFPRGLKAVSDHAHTNGLGLIVWFEPERVSPGTWLYTNQPAWLLGRDGEQKLLNLGNPAARAWLTDHVDAMIAGQGIDLYRQDFNIDPLPFWRANDTPDRQGITEIGHVAGYLAFWDELRRRHPNLRIDSCASGGRRNDLETLRRAVPLLRSDYQSFDGNPAYAPGNQGHTYGLSSWIPYYGQGVYFTPNQFLYSARSYLSPAFAICADVRKPGVDWETIRRVASQWREVAPAFLGDFHPLTPYSLDATVWMAWQFDRPEAGEGFVQVFRRADSVYEAGRFKLQGLDPEARYKVRDQDQPEALRELSGRELMEKGLLVTLDRRPGAAILTYRVRR
jgi:alpha-galactosidase